MIQVTISSGFPSPEMSILVTIFPISYCWNLFPVILYWQDFKNAQQIFAFFQKIDTTGSTAKGK